MEYKRQLSTYKIVNFNSSGLHFYIKLMERMRVAILEEKFDEFRTDFLATWNGTE